MKHPAFKANEAVKYLCIFILILSNFYLNAQNILDSAVISKITVSEEIINGKQENPFQIGKYEYYKEFPQIYYPIDNRIQKKCNQIIQNKILDNSYLDTLIWTIPNFKNSSSKLLFQVLHNKNYILSFQFTNINLGASISKTYQYLTIDLKKGEEILLEDIIIKDSINTLFNIFHQKILIDYKEDLQDVYKDVFDDFLKVYKQQKPQINGWSIYNGCLILYRNSIIKNLNYDISFPIEEIKSMVKQKYQYLL